VPNPKHVPALTSTTARLLYSLLDLSKRWRLGAGGEALLGLACRWLLVRVTPGWLVRSSCRSIDRSGWAEVSQSTKQYLAFSFPCPATHK